MDFDIADTAPEHKSGIPARGDYDDFRTTFEEFKSANDERLTRLEKKRGDVLLEDSRDNLIHAEHRLVAGVGIKDHVIVETKDAVLVTTRGKAQ